MIMPITQHPAQCIPTMHPTPQPPQQQRQQQQQQPYPTFTIMTLLMLQQKFMNLEGYITIITLMRMKLTIIPLMNLWRQQLLFLK